MRKIYISIFLVLSCLTIKAQTKIDKLSMTYGEEITDDKGKIIKIIGENHDKVYTLVLKGKSSYHLKIFDSAAMKHESSVPLVLPELKDRDVEFEEIFLVGEKIYVIGSVYHRKDKIYTSVAIEVADDGSLNKNIITLFESKVAKSSDRGGFYFKLSADEQMLLAMHTSLYDKEDAMKYEIKLFDQMMVSRFKTEDKISYDDNKKDYQFTISDFDVNNKDDVFLVVNEGYRDNKKKEKVEKFELFIFKAAKSYAKEVVKIDVKDTEIINCKMLSSSNNTIQMVGFYSSVRESGRANKELKGVYNVKINLANNAIENLKFNEFDYATKVKLLGERRAKKGKDVKPLYSIHTIIEKNDGGLTVLCEYQTIIVGQTQGFGPIGLTPVTYTTNEIIVTSLKSDGTLDWSNVVAKEQSATVTSASFMIFGGGGNGAFNVAVGLSIPLGVMGKGPEYLSAIPIYQNGELSIMFNDNAKNKGVTDIEEIRPLGNWNVAIPTLFVFDNKGNITRKDPDEIAKNEVVVRPGVFYRKNDNEYLIYASRRKQDKLGRMVLEN